MINRLAASATAIALAFALLLVAPGTASAHEERTIGKYHFAVGFGDEPAYTGLKNSVQLLLRDSNDKPVTNLTDTLKVEVIVGSQKMQLPLEATFDPDTHLGAPGDYRAWFIPTVPGKYTFHFFGSIGTQNIDQSFASGPTTFNDVVDPAQVEFPAKVPSGAQIAARLDREVPRLTNAIQAVDGRSADRAGSARTLALVGVVLGGLGLALGGTAFVVARRRVSTPPPPAPAERHLTPEAERS